MITITKPTLPDYVSGWQSVRSYDPSSGSGEANSVYCFRWTINGYKFNWTFAVADVAEMQSEPNHWESYWATMFARCLAKAEAQAKPPLTAKPAPSCSTLPTRSSRTRWIP